LEQKDEMHRVNLILSPTEHAKYRLLGVTHKAIYRKGLDAYEEERRQR
jgi:hypothetical protein